MQFYIEFLNKSKGFNKDKKHFLTYEAAKKWAANNFVTRDNGGCGWNN
jgi:hypothetical protein